MFIAFYRLMSQTYANCARQGHERFVNQPTLRSYADERICRRCTHVRWHTNVVGDDKEARMADQGWKIAIVGGGIGGLTLGLALREQRLEGGIYEQAGAPRGV